MKQFNWLETTGRIIVCFATLAKQHMGATCARYYFVKVQGRGTQTLILASKFGTWQ
jgi:hypothetical protein